nr:hypothetical protein GCM10025732_29590 [Glycomyces mayteni]
MTGLAGEFFDRQRERLRDARKLVQDLARSRREQSTREMDEVWNGLASTLRSNPFVLRWDEQSRRARQNYRLRRYHEHRADALDWFAASAGSPAAVLPVAIFLGDGTAALATQAALEQLLDETGVDVFHREPPVQGSWFRKLWARGRAETAHLTAEQIAAELERKIRIEVFDKAQAQIDHQQATGAAALIASLQGEERACIQVGSLLVIKANGAIVAKNLTQYQLAWLERNQTLLRDPEGLVKGLETLSSQSAVMAELLQRLLSPDRLAPAAPRSTC